MERRFDIGYPDKVKLFPGELMDRLRDGRCPGVEYKNIGTDLAECLRGGLWQSHIGNPRLDALHLVFEQVESPGIARNGPDVCSLCRQCFNDGTSKPPATAGDERDLLLQLNHTSLSLGVYRGLTQKRVTLQP